jgi:hypothetical protein
MKNESLPGELQPRSRASVSRTAFVNCSGVLPRSRSGAGGVQTRLEPELGTNRLSNIGRLPRVAPSLTGPSTSMPGRAEGRADRETGLTFVCGRCGGRTSTSRAPLPTRALTAAAHWLTSSQGEVAERELDARCAIRRRTRA